MQGVQCCQDRRPGRGRVERDGVEHLGQEPSQALVAAQQLQSKRPVLPVVGVGLLGDPCDGVGDGLELVAADVRVDRRPQLVKTASWRVEQDENRGAQAMRGAVEVGQLKEVVSALESSELSVTRSPVSPLVRG